MAKLDFKTEEGKAKAKAIAEYIFRDFDDVETEFSESGYSATIRLDDCFEYTFTEEGIIQAKSLITLLQWKKLDKLTNGAHEE